MVSKQNVNYAAWTHLAAATHCVETLLTIISCTGIQCTSGGLNSAATVVANSNEYPSGLLGRRTTRLRFSARLLDWAKSTAAAKEREEPTEGNACSAVPRRDFRAGTRYSG